MPEQEMEPQSLTFLAGTRAPPPSVLLLHIYTNTLPVDLILVHRQGRCPTFFIFYSAQHIKCA